MGDMDQASLLHRIETANLELFANSPNKSIPAKSSGVYTIWKGPELIYAGMARKALRGRLHSHSRGVRGGDQFCIYISDRYIVPRLSVSNLRAIGRGKLSLDDLTREFIRKELSYRWIATPDHVTARSLEADLRSGVPFQ